MSGGSRGIGLAIAPAVGSRSGNIVLLAKTREWLGKHPGYMLAECEMTLAALGFAAEYADAQLSSNCLWPRSIIATAAVENLLGGKDGVLHSRSPEVMAEAAIEILLETKGELSGRTLIDVDVLARAGKTDLARYGGVPPISYDIFVDPSDDANTRVADTKNGR
ncbi:hypothetical protein [Rhodococcus sp. NPDC006774]|uniref:hypothetical protein n=1 Tax=Rhodococcus sp. NPDC006774 TaxID=3157186 RepID=UPI003411F575